MNYERTPEKDGLRLVGKAPVADSGPRGIPFRRGRPLESPRVGEERPLQGLRTLRRPGGVSFEPHSLQPPAFAEDPEGEQPRLGRRVRGLEQPGPADRAQLARGLCDPHLVAGERTDSRPGTGTTVELRVPLDGRL